MGIYRRYIGPRLINAVCGMAAVTEQRRLVVPQAHGVVLEIGIGGGLNLPHYDPKRVTEIIGVEPSRGFLALSEARRRASGIPLRIIEAGAENIPLPDATADTAVLTYTLCSVDDPLRVLAEIKRVLKPGGKILFLEHGLSDDPAVAKWQHRLNPIWRPIGCGCNLNRDTLALFAQAGIAVESVERFYLPGEPKFAAFHCRGVAAPT